MTGASHRNWASYGEHVRLPAGLPDWMRHLLTDPQTSGGLLVACAPKRAKDIALAVEAAGYPDATLIGYAEAGMPVVKVTD